MRAPPTMHVHGSGKVGRALAGALRRAGWRVSVSSERRTPAPRMRALVVVLAVRDGMIAQVARRWAALGVVAPDAVVLHTAGARRPEELAALRGCCGGVGQMHPLVSIVSNRSTACWGGATMLVDGDPAAVAAGKRIAKALGMVSRSAPDLDRGAYHAAAGMVAGGAAALVRAASDVLVGAGVDRRAAERMLGPLLRSVADNIEREGLPAAMTGAIRRGDWETLVAHREAVRRYAVQHAGMLAEMGAGQLAMARELRELSEPALNQVARVVAGLTGTATDASRERKQREDGGLEEG